MSADKSPRWLLVFFVGVLSLAGHTAASQAEQLLVVDRLTDSVYRYGGDGTFLGLVLTDGVNLSDPTGIAVSPDYTKLYVSSSQNNQVVQYDYNAALGTAANPTIFADGADGLVFPNAIRFSQDGSKIYVSNLGGSGVAQFTTTGASAGAPVNGLVGGGAFFQFSGLAYAPTGELLVGAFQDFPGATVGAVAKSDPAITTLLDFVAPSAEINGASGLLVRGDDLYVAGLFAGTLRRFDVNTGAIDAAFGVNALSFPQDLIAAPDGNGFLVGVLGAGNISRYDYDGNFLGVFASAGAGQFFEATAFAVVPEPSSVALLAVAMLSLGCLARRRMTK